MHYKRLIRKRIRHAMRGYLDGSNMRPNWITPKQREFYDSAMMKLRADKEIVILYGRKSCIIYATRNMVGWGYDG